MKSGDYFAAHYLRPKHIYFVVCKNLKTDAILYYEKLVSNTWTEICAKHFICPKEAKRICDQQNQSVNLRGFSTWKVYCRTVKYGKYGFRYTYSKFI